MAGAPPRGHASCCAPIWPSCYDAFETPRAVRGEIEALGPRRGARLPGGRPRAHGRGDRARRASATGRSARWCSATSSSTPRRCARRWRSPGLLAAGEPRARPPLARSAERDGSRSPPARSRWAPATEGFAYDNERPRHTVELPAFQIARRPVSNASWMRFSEGGGYERREWWSDEGWAWKQEYDIAHHPRDRGGPTRDAPACHVSWFEADAFARAHDARLPTEAEWEKAAARAGRSRRASPALAIGQVWEWTQQRASTATPASSPTPTASTPRCSSARTTACCAAARGRRSPRVASRTFRNWDLPAAPADLRRRAPGARDDAAITRPRDRPWRQRGGARSR